MQLLLRRDLQQRMLEILTSNVLFKMPLVFSFENLEEIVDFESRESHLLKKFVLFKRMPDSE